MTSFVMHLLICRVENFLYVIDFLQIFHVEKLLHMTDFSPQAQLVVLVTDIRYGAKYKTY